jgi:hypothetical protein
MACFMQFDCPTNTEEIHMGSNEQKPSHPHGHDAKTDAERENPRDSKKIERDETKPSDLPGGGKKLGKRH